MRFRLACVLVLITTMGCFATRPLLIETPTADQATLYVYRPSDMMVLSWPHVYVNGEEVGELKVGGYLRVLVSSGNVNVEIKNGGNPLKRYIYYWPGPAVKIDFVAKSGNTYYAKYSPAVTAINAITPTYTTASYRHVIDIVPNDVGNLDIVHLDAKYK